MDENKLFSEWVIIYYRDLSSNFCNFCLRVDTEHCIIDPLFCACHYDINHFQWWLKGLSHWAKVNYPLFSFGCLTTSPLAKISSVQNPSTCLHGWKIALSFIISNHLISNHVRFARNFTWKYAVWVITGFHKESDSTWCKKKFMSDVMPEQAGLGRLSCRDCVLSYLWRIVLYLLKKSYKHFTEYIQQWSSPQSNIHMGPTPVLLPCRPLWDKAFSICEKGFIGLVVLNHKNTDHVILIMIELNSLYTSSYNILSYWVV